MVDLDFIALDFVFWKRGEEWVIGVCAEGSVLTILLDDEETTDVVAQKLTSCWDEEDADAVPVSSP